jgi:hypothetical protein
MLCFAWLAAGSLLFAFVVLLSGALVLHVKRNERKHWTTYAGDVEFKRRDWLNRLSLKQVAAERTPQMGSERQMEERQFTLE